MCFTYYWVEIRTRWRASFSLWPAPVVLHSFWEIRQLEQGVSLSHRICAI